VLKCKGSSTLSLSIHLKTHKIIITEMVATATFVAEMDYSVAKSSSRVSSTQ
jgi:hypothetical protein